MTKHRELVENKYNAEEIVLDSSDYGGVDFIVQ